MSNKSEATYHGRKRSFLAGDRVRFTQLPAFDHVPGEIAEIRDSLFPYLVRLDNGYYVGADWLCLIPEPFEATGEHIFHKLGDDLYQDWDDSKNPKFPLTAGQAADWAARDPEGYFAAVRADAEERAAAHLKPKVDHWTPTVGQIGLSLGIIAMIILIFVFVVIFYRW